MPPCTTTEKITSKLQNKYHPEPSENRAIGKSDNQGFKEDIFIQRGRSGGAEEQREVERYRQVKRCRTDAKKRQNRRSHIRMRWIKIGRDTSEGRDPSSKPDHPAAQGSSARKINPHNFWL